MKTKEIPLYADLVLVRIIQAKHYHAYPNMVLTIVEHFGESSLHATSICIDFKDVLLGDLNLLKILRFFAYIQLFVLTRNMSIAHVSRFKWAAPT